MDIEEKRKLVETPVTLNGKRAKITGLSKPFAMVRQIDTGLGCEFAWETVKRVVEKGGHFNS